MEDKRMEHATGCTFPRGLDVCERAVEDRRLAVPTHPQSISTCESTTSRYGSTEIDPDIPGSQKIDVKDKTMPQSGDEGSTEINPDIPAGEKTDATDRKIPQSGDEDKNSSKTQTGLTTESVRAGKVKIVKHKCDIELKRACLKGKLNVVKHIMSLGQADINCRDEYGQTPAMFAAMKGRVTVFKYLINQGCDLSLVDKYKNNVLHVALGKSTCKNIDIVRKIVDSGKCDLNGRGQWDKTPIILAAAYGFRDAFELLVGKGCNLTTVFFMKHNILHLACTGGNIDIVQYVLSQNIVGVDSRGIRGYTPVMEAAEHGRKRVVDLLVKKGCNQKVMDDQKNNILHIACYYGKEKVVEYLMTLRAVKGMVTAKNARGYTPVQVAGRMHRTAIVRLLKGWMYR